jgi:hypothetical protein
MPLRADNPLVENQAVNGKRLLLLEAMSAFGQLRNYQGHCFRLI